MIRVVDSDPLQRGQIEIPGLNVSIVGGKLKRANSQFDTYSLKHRLKDFADPGAFGGRFVFESQRTHSVLADRIPCLIEKLTRFFRIVRIVSDVAIVCPVLGREHTSSYSAGSS